LDLVSVLLLAGLGALILFSGVFSGSETALFSLDPIRLRRLERSGSRADRLVAAVAGRPERLLAGLLFGNTLVNVASSSVAVALARRVETGIGIEERVFLATLLDTALLVALGEVIPKGTAVRQPERFARALIWVLAPLLRLVQPVSMALEGAAVRLLAVLGVDRASSRPGPTRPELQLIFEDIQAQAGLTEDEGTIASNIFDFFETRAVEIMTPRVDVRAVEVSSSARDRLRVVMDARHSRLPVYRDSLDQVVGFINTKETLLNPDQPLEGLIKPVHFVPESARVSGILSDVQTRRLNMVVVVNEYGGTSGIITKEDLVEEIVGEIFDEQERHLEPEVYSVSPGVWRVDGLLSLEDLEDVVDRPVKPGPAQTVAGHVAHLLGRLPRHGDTVTDDSLSYRVVGVKRHRASRVEVTPAPGGGNR